MTDQKQPICALCGQAISAEEHDFCLANPGRFNDLAFCFEHRNRYNVCPAMRWQLGGRGSPR